MRENRLSGSEGGGAKPIVSPYPYLLVEVGVGCRLKLRDHAAEAGGVCWLNGCWL